MFDHIIKINDKGAELKLTNKDTDMNLLGLHLVFEKDDKKVVCEIDLVNEDIVTVILFLALSKFLISLQISFTVVSFVSVFCFIFDIN